MDTALLDDVASIMVLESMGTNCKSYQRERRKGFRRLVSEVYSPPRITKLLSSMPSAALAPGLALDLSCTDPLDGRPWDFSFKDKRERARKLLRRQRPLYLVGSPECKAFSTWQALNAMRHGPEVAARLERAKTEAMVHLRFVVELYWEQLLGGRYFLHEHPAAATSWQEKSMQQLMRAPGVQRVVADQCQYGAEVVSGFQRVMPI